MLLCIIFVYDYFRYDDTATAYKKTITLCLVRVKRERGWKKKEGKKKEKKK